MKIVYALSVVGGLLGASVAVMAHFLSRTVPSTFYLATDRVGRQVNATVETPLVHPSWWPSLPAAVGIGLLAGALLGLAANRAGVRLARTARISEAS